MTKDFGILLMVQTLGKVPLRGYATLPFQMQNSQEHRR